MPDRSYRRIFITGASAGIGLALAEAYAASGITLGLVARREDRLKALAERFALLGCRVLTFAADVGDAQGMRQAAREFCEQAGGVDLVIANAGINRPDQSMGGDPTGAAEVIHCNVNGVLHTLLPMVPAMVSQGSGHLVAIGSVAGFRGLPGNAPYCASKAAVKTLMDAYRPVLRRKGIRVTTICPGYVESELTAKTKNPMPFLMPAEKAARLIRRAISRGASTYVFPWQMRLLVPLLTRIPDRLFPVFERRS